MQIIDTFALVGEVLSWIGLGVGIPLLVIAGMIALAEGRWDRIDMVVIQSGGALIARWFAGGEFHERPLTSREQVEGDWHQGFVSVRNPSHVRTHPPMLRRFFLTLGSVFTAIGVAGFVVSMIPAFV